MMKQMRQTASQFQNYLYHSKITLDILEALCCIIFTATAMLIEDSPPPSHKC